MTISLPIVSVYTPRSSQGHEFVIPSDMESRSFLTSVFRLSPYFIPTFFQSRAPEYFQGLNAGISFFKDKNKTSELTSYKSTVVRRSNVLEKLFLEPCFKFSSEFIFDILKRG